MLFLLVLLLLFGLMIWLTLYPLGFPKTLLNLKGIDDLNFKLLLLGIAALNFFAAFVLEVGQPRVGIGQRDTCCPSVCPSNPFSRSCGHRRSRAHSASALPSPCGLLPPQNLFSPSSLLQTALDHGLLGCLRKLRRKKVSKKLFKRLEKELSQQQAPWPPLNEPLFATPKMSIAVR